MMYFKIITTSLLLAILVVLACVFFTDLYWVWILPPITVWLILITIASFSMSCNVFLKSFTSNNNITSKKIAITFDDGPHPKYTLSILNLLEEFNAKATFFCIGKHVDQHPGILNKITEKGHSIGNHSYSHNNFIGFSSEAMWLEEINRTDSSIECFSDKKTKLFRPPFGVTTPNLAKAIKKTKHTVVGWNIRSFDTALKNKDLVLNHIIKNISPGSIILLHDTQPNTLYILEHLLQHLVKNKYEAVTVNNLLDEI